MMVSLDVYRPAAQEQLKTLGEQNDILTLPSGTGSSTNKASPTFLSASELGRVNYLEEADGGDQQKFDLNKRLQPGESTEWMDLASEARCVAVMRIEAEPDRRKRGVKDARVVFWAR